MATTLTDDEILDGLRRKDERITKRYFYGYCRMAYYIFNGKYGLDFKPGMDFYSLAHEYYIALDRHAWKQLEDRPPGTSLKNWMIGGFRFLLLDRLKGTELEMASEDIEKRAANDCLQFDMPSSEFNADVRRTIEELCNACFGRDHKKSILLKMLLVEGYKGKEVAAELGMTPSAVTQQYHKLMDTVVIPYFKRNYIAMEEPDILSAPDMDYEEDNMYVPMARKCSFIDLSLKGIRDSRDSDIHNDSHSDIHSDIHNDSRKINKLAINKLAFMKKDRKTPEFITKLQPDEVFVFGSNLAGMHGGGAARIARIYFGAKMGQGVGLQGSSYAIPTMQGGTETIAPYVDEFIAFAKAHPQMHFLVTRIGCGIAGFDAEDIAPLFRDAVDVKNISLPADFWEILLG